MCGILVVISKKKKLDIAKCKKSLNLMKNRGPDWIIENKINGNIFMGQTVLSMTGMQKKNLEKNFSDSKNYFLLLVGEIYNYGKLSLNYLNKLINDKTSDTNVLVNLFDKIKENKINHLIDGMYAYVVFNKKKNSLIFSKDPNGEKNLYIFEDNLKIIICSEINPILFYNENNNLNLDVLKNYFFTRHFINLEKTIFNGIKKIKPGLQVEINLNNYTSKIINKISLNNFINPFSYKNNKKRSLEDLIDELDFLLNKNIKEMIPKNRKFASIVSGGIDSSLVTFYLCKNSNPECLIFLNHVGKDEHTNKIKKFEKFFKRKIYVKNVNEKDYLINYLKCIKICNSPINSHSFVGQFIVSNIVSQFKVRGLFGGEGADELFGGYETYINNNLKKNLNNSDYTKIFDPKLFPVTPEQVLFKKKMKSLWMKCLDSYSFIQNKNEKQKNSMMLMDATVQMENNAFIATDLLNLSNSVEGRSLFYRKEIIQFALNLPFKYKINIKASKRMKTKFILKNLFLKKFSKSLILKKQGFAGFPNEMKKFMGPLNNFVSKDQINYFNIKEDFYKNRSIQWKILNTEMYLRKLGYKYL